MGTSSSDFEVGKLYNVKMSNQTFSGIVQKVEKDAISFKNPADNQLTSILRKDITDADEFGLGAKGHGPWLNNGGHNQPDIPIPDRGQYGGKETGGGAPGRKYHAYGCTCGKCYGGGCWVD